MALPQIIGFGASWAKATVRNGAVDGVTVNAGRGFEHAPAENDVALKVRQLYYNILVTQSQHQAIEAKIRAVEDLKSERVQQVKYGSTLEVDLIESKAQLLQAKQDLLTTELQLSDLRLKFNDIVGLPLKSDIGNA